MNIYRIHRVAKLTGLSKDVIRIWERRFGVVQPIRGANRYRNYSDEDVAVLRFLKVQQADGVSIGVLAKLGRAALVMRAQATAPVLDSSEPLFTRLMQELLSSLIPFNGVEFQKRLYKAVAIIPFEEALHGILLPLEVQVGELWHAGRLSLAIERYLTSHIHQKIFSGINQFPVVEEGPHVVVACLPGEEHDLGALAVAYRCRVRGYGVYYLGTNVSVEALRAFCLDVGPGLTIISMPFPRVESAGLDWVATLAQEILPHSPLVIGGAGGLALRERFADHRIPVLESFAALDHTLEQMRRPLR